MTQDQLLESQQLYERVSELEQLKSDMIRIAAHDLRNPLNIISGFTELILDGDGLPERERDQLEHVYRAAGRMQTLVVDILSLDRIERLHEGGYNKLDLVELVQNVYESHEVKAEKINYRLELPDYLVSVQGDAPQLREAISNFVGNALKYTPDGGSVTVRLVVEESQAIFEVEDTGYGIPEDAQAKLFEPFYRVKDKDTRNIEGTGLGLHLVKNIIERHNGRVFVHSTYGQGSTFGFRIDLDTASEDDQSELVST
jgi:signal transduction histidine kinase